MLHVKVDWFYENKSEKVTLRKIITISCHLKVPHAKFVFVLSRLEELTLEVSLNVACLPNTEFPKQQMNSLKPFGLLQLFKNVAWRDLLRLLMTLPKTAEE